MKKMTINIKDGIIEAHVEGMKGKGCSQYLDMIDRLGTTKKRTKTKEFYEKQTIIVQEIKH